MPQRPPNLPPVQEPLQPPEHAAPHVADKITQMFHLMHAPRGDPQHPELYRMPGNSSIINTGSLTVFFDDGVLDDVVATDDDEEDNITYRLRR